MNQQYRFDWNLVGDLEVGRPNLGPLSMSVGVAAGSDGAGLRQAIKLADERMYADKLARRAGRAG